MPERIDGPGRAVADRRQVLRTDRLDAPGPGQRRSSGSPSPAITATCARLRQERRHAGPSGASRVGLVAHMPSYCGPPPPSGGTQVITP